ncbi:ATP-binding protein [Sedimenticola selenatireducens]|uniref:histidine kinase n=1 Tax=Sedimenticola selenatireducens TaxID=191960 RepID=A0A557RZY6_9GAMM|nr:ATP-binding protein [Sedimenticola selenatireducens]TVO70726.1 response regulator [Sedimenticola selenatireducens]TVT65646.1 MAG: response regulator [Sedimenticola selenatireducens]
MNIRWKLFTTISTALVINLAVGFYASISFKQATNNASQIAEQTFQIVTESLATQVHFKKQVQEWKNILIRGHQPLLYQKYLDQFQQEEQKTQHSIVTLLSKLEPNTPAWQAASDFKMAHLNLGQQYRQALDSIKEISSDTTIEVDRQVRGIDRQPTELMDQVVASAVMYKQEKLEKLTHHQREIEQRILIAVISLLTLTIITLVWLADRMIAHPIVQATNVARRITQGNLTGPIPERGNDEAGELLQALKTMQESLAGSQNELKHEKSLLSERVERRTLALNIANAELAQAAKTKDMFLATMSHELRTPLTTVMGLTEMLQDALYGPVNSGQNRALGTIQESSRHLLTLINDILDVAKVESGKMELKWDYLPVDQLVEASLRLVRQPANMKRHHLEQQIDPSVKLIHGDGRRLKQLLVNLLSNAIKFTPEGGKIGLQIKGNDEQGQVELSVWDDGIGIETTQLQHLFEPFVQLDNESTRRYSGTGLGLTLVKRMAQLHGGDVAVESEVGKGSRFTVTLPWSRDDNCAHHQKLTEAHLAGSPAQHQSIQGVTLLLTEDNPANQAMMSDFLRLQGFNVVSAGSGIEALKLAYEHLPGIILMDIQLSDMDGLEVTRQLRNHPVLANTPIIALTALAMPGDRERCLDAGMNDYLSKPVGLKEIYHRLLTYL